MAITYVNDLRLSEMATGDNSGSWGTVTNTNLELVGEALGFGTEAITTNADAHTSTIADGSTDPIRAIFIKYTGTLDSACTITIGPNTVNKFCFIHNATSGSQSIIISQGSGANVTIATGQTKGVYLDGAGSGAAVVDAFATLSVVDLLVDDDLTVTDDVAIGGLATVGGTLAVTGQTTGTGAAVSAPTYSFIGDTDTGISRPTANAVNLVAGGTERLRADSGGVDVFGSLDVSVNAVIDGTALVTGVLTTTAATVFNGGFASNAVSTISTADNLDTLSLISTDADANSGPNLRLYRNSGSPADGDAIGLIEFEGRNDNSQDVVYASIDARVVDASDGTEDGRIELGTILGGAAGISRILMDGTETVFNDNSADLDFRVESNDIDNMLFVNGGTNQVSIGGDVNGAAALHVVANHTTAVSNAATMLANTTFSVDGNDSQGSDTLRIGPKSADGAYFIEVSNSSGAAAYPLLLNPINGGSVGIGTLSPVRQLSLVNSGSAEISLLSGTSSQCSILMGDGTSGSDLYRGYIQYDNDTDRMLIATSATTRLTLNAAGNLACLGVYADTGGDSANVVVDSSGNIYRSTSALKYKQDIRNLESIDISSFRPVRYKNNSERGDNTVDHFGFIADEFHDAGLTELVSYGVNEETGETEVEGFRYDRLTALLTKTLQEAMTRIETLEAKVAVLEG